MLSGAKDLYLPTNLYGNGDMLENYSLSTGLIDIAIFPGMLQINLENTAKLDIIEK